MAALEGLGCPGLRKATNGVGRQVEWKPAPSCPSRWQESDRPIVRVKTVRQQCKYLRVAKVTVAIGVQWYYFCFSPCIHRTFVSGD